MDFSKLISYYFSSYMLCPGHIKKTHCSPYPVAAFQFPCFFSILISHQESSPFLLNVKIITFLKVQYKHYPFAILTWFPHSETMLSSLAPLQHFIWASFFLPCLRVTLFMTLPTQRFLIERSKNVLILHVVGGDKLLLNRGMKKLINVK